MRFLQYILGLVVTLVLASCTEPEIFPGLMPTDGGQRDASSFDAGPRDAAREDSGPRDASEEDAHEMDAHLLVDANLNDAAADARVDAGLDSGPPDLGTDFGPGLPCTPRTSDATGIGMDCSSGEPCPSGYDCVLFDTLSNHASCQVPCAIECGGVDCPFGTLCTEQVSESGIVELCGSF